MQHRGFATFIGRDRHSYAGLEAVIPAVVDELCRRDGVAGLEWRCLD